MAKSIRAKAKMANRKKKREGGNYAAADAARVQRLSAKLLGKGKGKGKDEKALDTEGDAAMEEEEEEVEADVAMDEGGDQPKKISTSAPRDTRREKWRASKGMAVRPKKGGVNRQGLAVGKHKAGRPKRRR